MGPTPYLTDSLYGGFGWMSRPIVLVMLAVLVGPAIWALVKWVRNRRRVGADDSHVVGDDLRHQRR